MTRIRGLVPLALALAAALLPHAAAAEAAWVRGAPLTLRSGAGNEFRIKAMVAPGDPLEVLERGSEWTRVQTREGEEGWVPAGFLDPTPPPAERVAQLESELEALRGRAQGTDAEMRRLRETAQALSGTEDERRAEVERLTKENLRLRAGERWTEWLTGASLLATGMVAGAILSRVGGRRTARRLKL